MSRSDKKQCELEKQFEAHKSEGEDKPTGKILDIDFGLFFSFSFLLTFTASDECTDLPDSVVHVEGNGKRINWIAM